MRKIMILTALATLVVSSASLAAIKCDASNGSFGNVNCVNDDDSNLTSVTIARMPRWKFNSGLRLITICNQGGKRILGGKNYENIGRVLEEVVGEDYYNEEARNADGTQCVRRYCSDDIEAKGFLLNGIFVPLTGWAGIGLKYSFYAKEIKVDCKPVIYDPFFNNEAKFEEAEKEIAAEKENARS